jgi:hypothetical protein
MPLQIADIILPTQFVVAGVNLDASQATLDSLLGTCTSTVRGCAAILVAILIVSSPTFNPHCAST